MTQDKKNFIILGVFCVFVVGSGAVVLLHPNSSSKDASLQKYADDVIAECSKKEYPPSCYDTEIPKVMDKSLTMEQAFAVTKLIQAQDKNYYYCHVLGHNLSAKETAKNPQKWMSVIARCPTGTCSNGCLHGAAQERFRGESLTDTQIEASIPELQTICEPAVSGRDYTDLEQGSCWHSLGHLTMYLTAGKIVKATGVCDDILGDKPSPVKQLCYDGAYMQIYQPLEPEDFTLVKDVAPSSQKDSEAFCNTFTGARRASCFSEAWPLYYKEIPTATGLERFCSLVGDEAFKDRCYRGMFYILSAQTHMNDEKVTALCSNLLSERKGECFALSASRYVETDYQLAPRALAFCAEAERQGVGERCYTEMVFSATFAFHKGSEDFKKFCALFPSVWVDKCLAGDSKSPL